VSAGAAHVQRKECGADAAPLSARQLPRRLLQVCSDRCVCGRWSPFRSVERHPGTSGPATSQSLGAALVQLSIGAIVGDLRCSHAAATSQPRGSARDAALVELQLPLGCRSGACRCTASRRCTLTAHKPPDAAVDARWSGAQSLVCLVGARLCC
jgi:hypothetical protein